jgi:hypothetical protein
VPEDFGRGKTKSLLWPRLSGPQFLQKPNDALVALMTDDVHNPAVNWYNFHNRDGLVRRKMRFARM